MKALPGILQCPAIRIDRFPATLRGGWPAAPVFGELSTSRKKISEFGRFARKIVRELSWILLLNLPIYRFPKGTATGGL
tara:strand:+ start:704 stop:940 length:237 start_codon:yes stop_codon:yes gene_type:complete